MSETRDEIDLLIVGAGVAGWTAATRARQLGARVVVIERAKNGPSGGNGMFSGGIFHAAYLSPKRPPEDLYRAIMDKTDGTARPDVARAWSENVGRAFDLLDAAGGRFRPFGPAEFQQNQAAPPDEAAQGEVPNGGAIRLLSALCGAYVDGGGELRLGTAALDLVVEDGAVGGVVVRTPDGRLETISAKAVLLADGGFGANRDFVHQHISPSYVVRASENDRGDALRMGLALGAKAVELQAFYGFVLCRDAVTNERFVRLRLAGPQPFQLINAAILVDGHGDRIGDEDAGDAAYSFIDEPLAGKVAKSRTPENCWVVFDDDAWQDAGRAGRPDGNNMPMNPYLVEFGGTLVQADSIDELARAMGISEDGLIKTVDGFNRHVREGAPIVPPRGGSPRPIARGPFYAVPLVVGVVYTMGGLLVNGRAEVLNQSEQAIPGLYAAGGAMGGLQGGPRNGYSGGWSEASTFGMLAAESALESVPARVVTTVE